MKRAIKLDLVELETDVRSGIKVVDIAKKFAVSRMTIRRRLLEIGLRPERTATVVWKDANEVLSRKRKPPEPMKNQFIDVDMAVAWDAVAIRVDSQWFAWSIANLMKGNYE